MGLTFEDSADTASNTSAEVQLSATTTEVVSRTGRGARAFLLVVLTGLTAATGTVGLLGGSAGGEQIDDEAADHHNHAVGHEPKFTDNYHAESTTVQPPLPAVQPAGTFDPDISVANYDASVVAAVVDGALVYTVPGGPINQHWVDLPPGFELRALSTDGSKAALVHFETDDSGRTVGSDVLIAERPVGKSADPATVNIHHLDGLIEPEAFATDGRSLFVVDHQAGSEPGSYRIRPLNLETGNLEEMLGPTKQPLIEDMNGVGRRQVWGLDDGRLYTLYIRQTDHVHASGRPGSAGFVHILDLDEEWAFCLDLPSSFGNGDLNTTAMAVGAENLVVFDMSAGDAGQLATASTTHRSVTEVVDLPRPFRRAVKAMLVAASEQPGRPADWEPNVHLATTTKAIAVGVGDAVVWFDRETLEPLGQSSDDAYRDRVELPGPLLGLTSLPGDSVLAWIQGHPGPLELVPGAGYSR